MAEGHSRIEADAQLLEDSPGWLSFADGWDDRLHELGGSFAVGVASVLLGGQGHREGDACVIECFGSAAVLNGEEVDVLKSLDDFFARDADIEEVDADDPESFELAVGGFPELLKGAETGGVQSELGAALVCTERVSVEVTVEGFEDVSGFVVKTSCGDDGCAGGLSDCFLKFGGGDSGLGCRVFDGDLTSECLGERRLGARLVHEGLGCEVGDLVGPVDGDNDVVTSVEPAFSDAEEDDGEVVGEVGAEDEGGLFVLERLDRVIDSARPGVLIGGEAVVDIRASDLTGEEILGGDVGFVTETLANDHADVFALEGFKQLGVDHRVVGLLELVVRSSKWGFEALFVVVIVVTELTLVTGPLFINRFVGAGVDPDDFSGAVVEPDVATVAAVEADGFGGLEIPWAGSEPVLAVGQGSDGADLDDVSAELGREFSFVESDRLGFVASEAEGELAVTGDFFGEANAAGALDAALEVERNVVAERERFDGVALLLDESAGSGTVEKGVVLERALAASVADRAVERVVDKEEFEDSFAVLVEGVRFGIDDQALADREGAGCGRLRHHTDGAVLRVLHAGFDKAHTAHADWLEARVVAEDRDFEPKALDGFDDQFAFGNRKFDSVDDDIDGLDVGRRCHDAFYEAQVPTLA